MRVEFILDNKEYALSSGLSGRLSIPAAAGQTKWLPVNTLKIADGRTYVLTADNNDEIKTVAVVAGRYTGDKVEIVSGLTSDQRVIINPNALLKEGDTVAVQEQ